MSDLQSDSQDRSLALVELSTAVVAQVVHRTACAERAIEVVIEVLALFSGYRQFDEIIDLLF